MRYTNHSSLWMERLADFYSRQDLPQPRLDLLCQTQHLMALTGAREEEMFKDFKSS